MKTTRLCLIRFIAFLTTLLTCAGALRAATVDDLVAITFTNSTGQVLPYRLWVPSPLDPSRRYPLVLFLHGAGERGTDNRTQLAPNPDPLVFVAAENQARWPCFFIAPQCPAGQTWAGMTQGDRWGDMDGRGDFTPDPTWPMAATMAALSAMTNSGLYAEQIDLGRLYVTGLSMGGYGTWEAVSRWPGVFSAAIPICGGGDPERVGVVGSLPVWMFHAADDTVVPAVRSRQMTEALRDQGVTARLTEYPASLRIGHASWRPAYADPELLPWLFGAANAGARPQFSLPPGVYGSNINVAISFPEPDAQIRWTRDGTVPSAQSTLYSEPIRIDAPAALRAMAFRAGGLTSAVVSADYLVTPYILTHVITRTVSVGTAVTFEVLARGVGELVYQWCRDGIDLPGANSNALTLTNAQLDQSGLYEVRINDSLGGITSSSGTLIVVIRPTIVLEPESQTVVAGDDVTFTVAATNNATLPIGFVWRKNSVITNSVLFSLTDSLTLFNVATTVTSTSGPGRYLVVLTNSAAPVYGPSAPNVSFNLVVLPATAPTASTLASSGTTPNGATLNASVNPMGAQTVAWFDYGLTTAFGNNTGATKVGNASNTIAFAQSLAGLSPNTTYHYRVVATNHGGIVLGQDVTFTTAASGATIRDFTLLENGQFRLRFTAASGTSNTVLGSTNLNYWIALGAAVELAPGLFEFNDADAPNHPTRFYQLRSP